MTVTQNNLYALIERDPKSDAVYYARGLAKKALGDHQSAQEDLSTAERLDTRYQIKQTEVIR